MLAFKVQYLAFQLGFNVERFETGNTTKDERAEITWVPAIRFTCIVGAGNWFNKNMLADKNVESCFSPCSMFVRYTREDKDDPESPYVLTGFNPVHSHPLSLKISLPIHAIIGR